MTEAAELNFPEVFLVETFAADPSDVDECDVYARLELAVEAVHEWLAQTPGRKVRVEVSVDEEGELEGVGFFDDSYTMLACVTVYRLERESGSAVNRNISQACRGPASQLETKLKEIFRF